MVRIQNAKLTRIGHSFGFLIPKALIDCEILEKKKKYIIEVKCPIWDFIPQLLFPNLIPNTL